MNLGFMNLHLLTVPIGNELAHVIGGVCIYSSLVYTGIIKPELLEIMAVINSL